MLQSSVMIGDVKCSLATVAILVYYSHNSDTLVTLGYYSIQLP